jgi:hypothetical protein
VQYNVFRAFSTLLVDILEVVPARSDLGDAAAPVQQTQVRHLARVVHATRTRKASRRAADHTLGAAVSLRAMNVLEDGGLVGFAHALALKVVVGLCGPFIEGRHFRLRRRRGLLGA